ncbi:hypothetical protein [Amycolatopsis saalfeldensis]|uniref:hypothetical protein n=1 Tax=Amycolatopsis saalfeldensis TaxID=394193 RepID=UPI0011606FAE|nr:hypothetical protein [Amycolatopsis saalfeldensis]
MKGALAAFDDSTGSRRLLSAGFYRLHLTPGMARLVRFTLPLTQFGYPGPIQVMVGAASDDIRATVTLEVTGPLRELTDRRTYLAVATAVPVPVPVPVPEGPRA